MQTFENLVKESSRKQSAGYIFNSSSQHAAILIREMIDKTEDRFLMLTGGSETGRYFNDKSIGKLKELGNKVEIILEPHSDAVEFFRGRIPNARLWALREDESDFFLRIPSLVLEDEDFSVARHFLISDNLRFRLEKNHRSEPNPENVSAIASFNRPEIVSSLSDVFVKIRTLSDSLN